MQSPRTPRIVIEDLPALELLNEEELAQIFGAGEKNRARLGMESLEGRDMMASSLTASLSGSVLRLEGTPTADTIRVQQSGDQISVGGIAINTSGGAVSQVAASQVSRIDVFGLDGDDSIILPALSHARVDVWGGIGNDYVSLTNQATSVKGEKGDRIETGGYVYELGLDGYLRQRSSSGTTWSLTEQQKVQSFAVTGDKLIVHAADGYLRQRGVSGGSWSFANLEGSSYDRVQDYAVERDCLIYLQNNGHLGARNWRSGTQTVSRNGVTDFAVGSGRVFMMFTDGYLRQQNLDGTGWSFANVENGNYAQVSKFDVTGDSMTYREVDGSLRVRDVRNDVVKVSREGVQDFAVAGGKVFMNFTDGYIRQQNLDGSGWLYTFRNPATGATMRTQGFILQGSRVYAQDFNGILFSRDVAAAPDRTVQVAGIQLAGGKQFFRESDGYLYRFDPTSNTLGKYDSTQVKSFDVTTDGYVFMLETNGKLFRQLATTTGAANATLFNSSLVDSFTVWADEVYMLETKITTNPGYLLRQGSNATTWTRMDYKEAAGTLYFMKGSYLYSFVRSSGEMHRVTTTAQSFDVSGNYLAYLQTNGTLTVENVTTGTSFSRGNDTATGAVLGYALTGSKAYMHFTDGYLRQQNLDGTGWTIGNIENGNYDKIQRFGVSGTYMAYLEVDGQLRVRDLRTDTVTITRNDIRDIALASGKVYTYSADGYLRQQNLDGTNWTFGNVENGNYDKVTFFSATNDAMTYLEVDGSLRVRDLRTGNLSLSQEGVQASHVGGGCLFTQDADGMLRRLDLASNNRDDILPVRWFAGSGNRLYFIDSASNTLLTSSVDTAARVSSCSPLAVQGYMAGGGKLYTIESDGSLRGYTLSTGACAFVSDADAPGSMIFVSGGREIKVEGEIWAKYQTLKNADGSYSLGLPTGGTSGMADRGVAQNFERGAIFHAPGPGSRVVFGGIWGKYLALGGANSDLGLPIADATSSVDGSGGVQAFQYGKILWSPEGGAFTTREALSDLMTSIPLNKRDLVLQGMAHLMNALNQSMATAEFGLSGWETLQQEAENAGGTISDGREAAGDAIVGGSKAIGGFVSDEWKQFCEGASNFAKGEAEILLTKFDGLIATVAQPLRDLTGALYMLADGEPGHAWDKFLRAGTGVALNWGTAPVAFATGVVLDTLAELRGEWSGRSLNGTERELLHRVFGNDIQLDRIKIVFDAFSINPRPYTNGTTIFVPADWISGETFVHEATHIVQKQTYLFDVTGTGVVDQILYEKGAPTYFRPQINPGDTMWTVLQRNGAEAHATMVEQFFEQVIMANKDSNLSTWQGNVSNFILGHSEWQPYASLFYKTGWFTNWYDPSARGTAPPPGLQFPDS